MHVGVVVVEVQLVALCCQARHGCAILIVQLLSERIHLALWDVQVLEHVLCVGAGGQHAP